MNKTAFVLLVLSILAVLVVGCTKQVPPDTSLPVEQNDFVDTGEQVADQEAVTLLPEGAPSTPAAKEAIFELDDPSFGVSYFTLSGAIYDKESGDPISGAVITPICDGKEMDILGIIHTDADGKFLLKEAKYDLCEDQSYAWFVVSYDGNDYTSDKVLIEQVILGSRGSSAPVGLAPTGVPEFTPFALGLAVIGVGLGLAFVRKH